MGQYRKLWWLLIAILGVTFSILGYFGTEVYRKAPPIPGRFLNPGGDVVMTKESILDGQTAWQSIGGMQLGSIWGHGAYQAPDWTADWLHRELTEWLNIAAIEEYGEEYCELNQRQQLLLQHDLKQTYRTNTYDVASDSVQLGARRIQAITHTIDYYDKLFGDHPDFQSTRESYAMKEDTLPNPERRARMAEFFFWTSWAASTERPEGGATYTNNWPHEPLIDNKPTAENIVWSIA